MADIYHDFPILASPQRVFETIGSSEGVGAWWALTAAGSPGLGEIYDLNFGPGYLWQAEISIFEPYEQIEWLMIDADSDWMDTRIGFYLTGTDEKCHVCFYHKGWSDTNSHFRTSSFCWAMYLRILKRHIEFGEFVPYDERLSV